MAGWLATAKTESTNMGVFAAHLITAMSPTISLNVLQSGGNPKVLPPRDTVRPITFMNTRCNGTEDYTPIIRNIIKEQQQTPENLTAPLKSRL